MSTYAAKTALRLLAVAFASSVALGLAGCTQVESKAEENGLDERTIVLSDGRTLTCVARTGGYRGGLSCDWDGAR